MRTGFPMAQAGQKIGLLGGSFDPAHAGHLHLSRQALRGFNLDQVWWLVSPGNPLKTNAPAPYDRRLAAACEVAQHPRIKVTDIEARLGTRLTAETLKAVLAIYPGVRFTWLMGADNLADIHRWSQWRSIFAQTPVGVVARPGDPMSARLAKAARVMRKSRLPQSQAQLLGGARPPAWCYLQGPQKDMSSTQIREKGEWVS